MRSNVPGGVRVTAQPPSGGPISLGHLTHGQHPEALLSAAGWTAESPVTATLAADGALELTYAVTQLSGIPRQWEARRRDPDVPTDATGEAYQRVAAYAVVRSPLGVLLTQFTASTHVAGEWGLPGGGLEPGETPVEGVLREVLEETGQQVSLGPLLTVQSSHWLGRAPTGAIEDFHAIRIVYRAECADPSEPVVHDVGGTTGDARWVPLARVHELPLTQSWSRLETLVGSGPAAP